MIMQRFICIQQHNIHELLLTKFIEISNYFFIKVFLFIDIIRNFDTNVPTLNKKKFTGK